MILPPFAIFEQELATNLTDASPAVSLWPGKSHLPGFFCMWKKNTSKIDVALWFYKIEWMRLSIDSGV